MSNSSSRNELFSVGGVGEMIVNALERHMHRPAFSCRGRRISYLQLAEQISRTIQLFEAHGVKRGEAVMQITANRYEMFVVMAAAYIGGYVSVVPNYSSSQEDHRYMLEDSGAVLLIVDRDRAERALQLQKSAQRPVQIWSHDEVEGLEHFWSAASAYAPGPLVARDRPQDNVRLIYTGGTTGLPKGVITTSSALAFASLLHIAEQNLSVETKLLVSSPLSHGAGALTIPVLCKGGQIVIHDHFDPDLTLDAIANGQACTLFLVPTMLYALMDNTRITHTDLSGLKRIIYTASPISPTRLQQALDIFGPILHQNYGQTEVPGTILSLRAEDHIDPRGGRLSSAGKPYPCVTVRLIDDHGEQVPRGGGIGELCVRAPHVTQGYWNKPEASRELLRDGWLHTGDMAYEDADGYFHIVDRKKDMIISGGFNIYPQELENVLTAHPAVSAAAVIGVPDPKWVEAVKAFIVLKEGCTIEGNAIISFVKERKGSVMAPKSIEFVSDLPLTNLGKVDKKALRSPYWPAGKA